MARRKDGRPEPIDLEVVSATVMWDRGQRGEQWYWRARRTDTRESAWTGWATRAEAVAILSGLVSKGLPPSRRVLREAVPRTVGDFLDRFTAHQEKRQQAGEIAPRSLATYRLAIGYWKASLGDVLVGHLTRELVEDTCTTWQASGVAPRTVKTAVDVLTAGVRWGAARGLCPSVSLTRLRAVKVRDDEFVNCSTTPSAHDLVKVLAHMAPPSADLIRLQAYTGARIGELAAAKVGDFDARRGTLRLTGRDEARQRRGKTGARNVPLVGEGLAFLVGLVGTRDASDPIVLDLNLDVSDQTRRALRDACVAAKVERFTSHGVRRMYAMQMLEAGVDAKTVSKITGHSVATLLKSYVRPTEESLRNAILRAGVAALPSAEKGKVYSIASGERISGTTDEDADG